jgi:hypothetical protein
VDALTRKVAWESVGRDSGVSHKDRGSEKERGAARRGAARPAARRGAARQRLRCAHYTLVSRHGAAGAQTWLKLVMVERMLPVPTRFVRSGRV